MINDQSTQPCGCDAGAGYTCARHRDQAMLRNFRELTPLRFTTMAELIAWLEQEIDRGGSPEHWAIAKDIKALAEERDLSPARANLEEAWFLTHGNRKASYGDVRVSFARYAKIWSGLLGAKLTADLTASDVALLMTALKLAREMNKQQSDNSVDAHGYLILHDEIKEADAREK